MFAGDDFCGDIDLARSAGKNIKSQLWGSFGCWHETKSGARRGGVVFVSPPCSRNKGEKKRGVRVRAWAGAEGDGRRQREPLLAPTGKAKGLARPSSSANKSHVPARRAARSLFSCRIFSSSSRALASSSSAREPWSCWTCCRNCVTSSDMVMERPRTSGRRRKQNRDATLGRVHSSVALPPGVFWWALVVKPLGGGWRLSRAGGGAVPRVGDGMDGTLRVLRPALQGRFFAFFCPVLRAGGLFNVLFPSMSALSNQRPRPLFTGFLGVLAY